MRLVICHGNGSKLYYDKNGEWYKTSMGNEVYRRYFGIAEDVHEIVCTEPMKSMDSKKINKITVGIKFIDCPKLTTMKGIFSFYKARQIIYDEIKNADYVILCLPGIFARIGYLAAKKFNKPFMAEVGGCAIDVYRNKGLIGKFIAPFAEYATKKIVRNSPITLYVTQKYLQDHYPSMGITAGCSDIALLDTDKRVLEARFNFIDQKKDEKIVIGTIGAVDIKYKGQQYVIKALAQLNKEGYKKKIEYQIVGAGNKTFLQKLAKKLNVEKQVKFLGTMSHEDIYKWMDSIDVYIQPSLTEGLPRSVVEAISRSLPCIGSNAGGIPEVIKPELVYDNKGNRVKSIACILRSLDKASLKNHAEYSYIKSREFQTDYLNKIRNEIFDELRKCKTIK